MLIVLSVVSIHYTNRMVSEYSTLVETSIEIKQELSVAHLWFEEIISGDSNEPIDKVWYHLDKSEQHALDVLKGGYTSQDDNISIKDPFIKQGVDNIRNEISLFRSITEERLKSINYAGVGSDIDQKYDSVFLGIIRLTDIVTKKLKSLRNRDLDRFYFIQKTLILLILGTGILVAYLLYRYQQRLIHSIHKQFSVNQALRKSEIRFRDIAHCGGDWVWEIDIHGRYTYVSDNVEAITGYPVKEILGHTLFDFMPENETDQAHEQFYEFVLNKAKIIDVDNWFINKKGKTICLRKNGVPICDDNGHLIGYRGVDKDVTERLLMDERLAKSQKMDALGKLTGGIAHDFNNTLSMILGNAELLKNELSDDIERNKYVFLIIQACDRAKKLISKLLTFSSKDIESPDCVDVNQLLRDDEQMLQSTLTERVKLLYELEVDLWPVLADAGALEDAVLNIAINAMHAISDTGTLTITTNNIHLNSDEAQLHDLSKGDYIRLSFADTGMGIDKNTLPKVFDPFFTTKGENGTGLGLSQVYGFVQQSRGAVTINSRPGKGTRLVIYLPRCTDTRVIHDDENDDLNTREFFLTGTETILVVDDKSEIRNMVGDILGKNGYQVISVENGIKALDVLEKEHVDLLLSDVLMPGMDGYELAEKVKTLYPSVKVQLTSGYAEIDHVSHIDDDLHQKLLTKPYHLKSLLWRIRELLDE